MECSFVMDNLTPFGGIIYFAVDGTQNMMLFCNSLTIDCCYTYSCSIMSFTTGPAIATVLLNIVANSHGNDGMAIDYTIKIDNYFSFY